MKIEKILVPHDLDQMSDRALLYAAELARALGAEVFLLHVIEEIDVPPAILLGADRAVVAKVRRNIATELQYRWHVFAQDKIRLLSSEKLQTTSDLGSGDAADEILRYAKEKKIDLIVMGSRRLAGVSKALAALGSVARKVSERAPCPVMIVH